MLVRWLLLSCVLVCPRVFADFSYYQEYLQKVADKVGASLPDQEQAIKQKNTIPPISTELHKEFCMHSRGWLIVTKPLIDYIHRLALKPEEWGEREKQFIHVMVKRGFGYAMVRLFKTLKAPRYINLLRLMKAYIKDDPACPIGCTYTDYHLISKKVSKSSLQRLDKVCSRYCPYVPVAKPYERSWCDCVVSADDKHCTGYDLQLLTTASAVHEHILYSSDQEFDDVFKHKKS